MILLWYLSSFVIFATISLWTVKRVFVAADSYIKAKRKGCGLIPSYPHLDPFLGLDLVLGMAKSLRRDYFLVWLNQIHKNMPKTFMVNFVGSRFIYTIEPANMKAMSAINWRDFAVGPMRRNNKATHPFADKGVNTVDGKEWEFSRFLIKPFFMREAFTNTQRLARHVDRLFDIFPEDGETVDIQPLVQRWFLDNTTESLFGESMESLIYPERAEICWSMISVLRGLRLRLQWYKYLFLFRQQHWLDAVQVVHDYLNHHIDRTIEQMAQIDHQTKPEAEAETDNGEQERTDLLWYIASNLKDKEALRSELCLIFVPNNDTTSVFICHILWNLARHPQVWDKCRAELAAVGEDVELTFEVLRGLKYLNAVLNESK